jgi:hypothetical protein
MGRLKALVRHADPSGMADLSNLLGDVYGDPAPETAPAPEPPAWADESRLDEAFADWSPEPLEAVVATAPSSAPSARLDDDLAAALSAALADAPRPPVAAPPVERFAHVDADDVTVPPVVDAATLERVPDTDPVGTLEAIVIEPPAPIVETAKKRGRSLSFSRSRKSAAPKPPSAALAPEPEREREPEPTAATVASPGAARPWQPSDDDILPARAASGRKSVSFRLR